MTIYQDNGNGQRIEYFNNNNYGTTYLVTEAELIIRQSEMEIKPVFPEKKYSSYTIFHDCFPNTNSLNLALDVFVGNTSL